MSSYIQPAEELCAKLDQAAGQASEEVLRTGIQYMAFLYRGLIAELKRATEWKPIATAPQTGVEIEAWDIIDGVRILEWKQGTNRRFPGWYLAGATSDDGPYEPTHWRELPPGPDAGP